jgi:hypothetical protein
VTALESALAGVKVWLDANVLVDTVRIELPAIGSPVLDPATGELTRPARETLYEGAGAVQATGQNEMTAAPGALQPWVQETRSRYVLLTPLTAPIPPKDAIVTVVQVHNPANTALIGRSFTCQDPGRASTVEVVRKTPLDQNQERGATP